MLETDPDAEFVAELTRHQAAIRLYVMTLLPGESGAADVAQQANATIWRKRDTFTTGTNFKAWAFQIARYEVLNFRKHQARDSRLVFSEELHDVMAEEISENVIDFEKRQLALTRCMEKLRPADRDLLRHRYFHKTPLKDYAAKANRSVSSLKVTLHRLRNNLAACIDSQLLGEERS